MHEHDLDLIAALADGSLREETVARALVDSCAECRAEYESQVAILEVLAAAFTVEMTELEKAALHRDLWTELRRAPSGAASTPWWYRWSYVAAGLFVLIGLVSVLSGQVRLGGGESAETFSEVDSGLSGVLGDGAEAPLQRDDTVDAVTESAKTTTTAAGETLDFPFADLADEARATQQSADQAYGTMSVRQEVEECLEASGLTEHVVVDELTLDQQYLVVMPADATAEPTVTFIALDECEIVYVDG
jgi:hypothetical protein